LVLAGAILLGGALPLFIYWLWSGAHLGIQTTAALPDVFRASSHARQSAALFSAFGIKPVYMTLSLLAAWFLRGRREPDLMSLRRAMLAFFIGEAFCYVNIFAYHHESDLSEYLHSYGMVVALGFAAFAFLEGLERRVLSLDDAGRKCALLGLCGRCGRNDGVDCGVIRLFQYLIPACLVLAGLPLLVEPSPVSYHTLIGRFPYHYVHSAALQLYESRICPLFAAPLLAASWLTLVRRKRQALAWSRVLFSAGLGLLLFSYLRLLLFSPFRDDLVWFDLWEEATELLGVASVAIFLWIFKRGLFAGAAAPARTVPPDLL